MRCRSFEMSWEISVGFRDAVNDEGGGQQSEVSIECDGG